MSPEEYATRGALLIALAAIGGSEVDVSEAKANLTELFLEAIASAKQEQKAKDVQRVKELAEAWSVLPRDSQVAMDCAQAILEQP